MYLDADEHIEAEDAPRLRELLGRTWREGFNLVETNYTGGEDTGSATTHLALRLWRRRPEYRFEGRIHEQKTHTMPMYLPERFETTHDPRPPLRLPEPADRVQGEVAAQHRAARAGGAREPEPVQRLQPRLRVPRPAGARRGEDAPRPGVGVAARAGPALGRLCAAARLARGPCPPRGRRPRRRDRGG